MADTKISDLNALTNGGVATSDLFVMVDTDGTETKKLAVSELDSRYAAASHNHAASDITSGTLDDARVAQSNVTQHEAALSITESQISDLGSYIAGITAEPIGDLSNVTITDIASGEILTWNGSAFINNTLAEAGIAAASHSHSTSDITSGTLADARVAQSNVTQHQAALSITESQISDLGTYTPTTRTLTAGAGLSGGGDLSTNRSFALDITGQTAQASPDGAADYVIIYDDAAGALRKVLLNNLPSSGGGEANTASNVGTGQGVFKQKSGTDLEFYEIKAGSSKVSVSLVSDDVTVDLGTVNLGDLSNVTITSIASGEVLNWNGSAFINRTLSEAGIAASSHTHTESEISDLGDYLTDITAEDIDDLDNVTINSVGDGEILAYDSGTPGWINRTLAEAGISGTSHTHTAYAQLAGRSGGQDQIGGTGSGEDLTLESTSHGTKGKIESKDQHQFDASAHFGTEVDNGNSGTADTIAWTAGNKQKSTLTGNCTFTFTAPQGACNLMLRLIQDGTGSRTVTWPATVKWPGGTAPTLTTDAAAIDIVSFYFDGTNYWGMSGLDFS